MDYDVVIVGGGPAGLAAAQTAAGGGARTLVVEKNAGIGIPVRTSGGSWIRDLESLGLPSHLWHPVRACRFISPNNSAVFATEEPLVCVLDVTALYQYLAAKAAEEGAEIWLGATATDVSAPDGSGRRLRVRHRERGEMDIRCRLVIDASGHLAMIGRKAGLPVTRDRYGVGAEYDFHAPHYDQDEGLVILGSQVAPAGYAWAAPHGKGRVRVGVGIIHPESDANPVTYLDKLGDRVEHLGRQLRGAQPVEFHTGIIPAQPPHRKLVAPHLLLVGDAACQASTYAGEGIRFAISAGRLAGDAAARAIATSDLREGFLYSNYERVWRRRHGWSMRIAFRYSVSRARYDDARWDRRVEMLKSFSPALLAELMRAEFSPSLFLKLGLHGLTHPRLLTQALPALAGKLLPRLSSYGVKM